MVLVGLDSDIFLNKLYLPEKFPVTRNCASHEAGGITGCICNNSILSNAPSSEEGGSTVGSYGLCSTDTLVAVDLDFLDFEEMLLLQSPVLRRITHIAVPTKRLPGHLSTERYAR